MSDEEKEQLIARYILAYNAVDIPAMLTGLSDDIVFENYANDELTMRLEGRDAFRRQAEQAAVMFSEREQKITSFIHKIRQTETAIAYEAVLASDLPNGMKKGDTLQLEGKSVFRFSGNKITGITDIS